MRALKNPRLLQALKRQPVDYTPIWIMRQAGRYLPEYREIRTKLSDFTELMKNPELACEVTMQPLRRFELDAAILFSDILTIPDALGLGLYFEKGEGPKFRSPVQTPHDIASLPDISMKTSLDYVYETVDRIRTSLKDSIPLLGFSGSPWTLATYMVEGGSSKNFATIKKLMAHHPDAMQQLIMSLANHVADYLIAQIEAGVDAVMLFDTWGGVLSTTHYRHYCLNAVETIVSAIRQHEVGKDIPIIYFTKNGSQWLELQADTGVNALGIDWTIEIEQAKARVGDKVALQGNLDPGALYGNKQSIEEEVRRILAGFGKGEGHVFNLGHGITPDIDPENVAYLVDTVHRLSREYHS